MGGSSGGGAIVGAGGPLPPYGPPPAVGGGTLLGQGNPGMNGSMGGGVRVGRRFMNPNIRGL